MDVRRKVSTLASQLGTLGYPHHVDADCSWVQNGEAGVFLEIIVFLFEHFWDIIGDDVVRLNRKCIPAGWLRGCHHRECQRIVGLLFGDKRKPAESFRKIVRVYRDVFGLRIPLGEDQFLRKGFVLKKLDIVLEILKKLRERRKSTITRKQKNDTIQLSDSEHNPRSTPHDIISADPWILSYIDYNTYTREDQTRAYPPQPLPEFPHGEYGEFLVDHPDNLHEWLTSDQSPPPVHNTHTTNPLFSCVPEEGIRTTTTDNASCLHQLHTRTQDALTVLQEVSNHL